MSMKRLICLGVLCLLAACGTPQEQCISAASRDIRVVDRLIREAEGNLQRGYGFETYTTYETEFVPCGTEANPNRVCARRVPVQERRPVAIDLAAEQVKLTQLIAKRARQTRAVAPVIDQCRIDNPE